MQDIEEATWIRQAQMGDREAFAELVKRYWGRIFRWLQNVEGCAHGAEDLTQEVFLKAWQALPTYQDHYFRAWLFRIARNAMIDRRRTLAGQPETALPAELSTKELEPLEQLLEREFQVTLADACRKLPESVRSTFLLWMQEQMPYEEIALTLDITEVTARWRVFRARRLLMRMLTPPRGPKKS